MKENGLEVFSTIGSLSLCRSLLRAGLVDRFRVGMFPVITGATGAERIYDGYPDVALEMIEHHLRRPHPAGRVQPRVLEHSAARRPCVTSPCPQKAGARPTEEDTRKPAAPALAALMLVGHSGTTVTELVYRHQIRPVIRRTGALVIDAGTRRAAREG